MLIDIEFFVTGYSGGHSSGGGGGWSSGGGGGYSGGHGGGYSGKCNRKLIQITSTPSCRLTMGQLAIETSHVSQSSVQRKIPTYFNRCENVSTIQNVMISNDFNRTVDLLQLSENYDVS